VKPVVDITWFSWQLWRLTGRRGMAFLYLYSLLGFACLKLVTPDFGLLANTEYRLEGAFRWVACILAVLTIVCFALAVFSGRNDRCKSSSASSSILLDILDIQDVSGCRHDPRGHQECAHMVAFRLWMRSAAHVTAYALSRVFLHIYSLVHNCQQPFIACCPTSRWLLTFASFLSPCRNVHTRLRTHAESIAFFGGGPREGRTVAAYFDRLTHHLLHVANIKWLHSVADDFFTKQLPFNVTWVLTLMYAVDQGEVANDPVAQVWPVQKSRPPLALANSMELRMSHICHTACSGCQ
jgi:hypothetical protein